MTFRYHMGILTFRLTERSGNIETRISNSLTDLTKHAKGQELSKLQDLRKGFSNAFWQSYFSALQECFLYKSLAMITWTPIGIKNERDGRSLVNDAPVHHGDNSWLYMSMVTYQDTNFSFVGEGIRYPKEQENQQFTGVESFPSLICKERTTADIDLNGTATISALLLSIKISAIFREFDLT